MCLVLSGRLWTTASVWEQGHRVMKFTLSHGTSDTAPVFVSWFVYHPCSPSASHWFMETNSRHGIEEKWSELEKQRNISGPCLLIRASLLILGYGYIYDACQNAVISIKICMIVSFRSQNTLMLILITFACLVWKWLYVLNLMRRRCIARLRTIDNVWQKNIFLKSFYYY